MQKILCGVGLAWLLLSGGCSSWEIQGSPELAASGAPDLPHDMANVDLMENKQVPGIRENVSMTEAKTGISAETELARQVQQGHEIEQQLAQLALIRTKNWKILEAARKIAADHRMAEKKLKKSLLVQLPLSIELSAEQGQLKTKLSGLDGAAFDQAYLDAMVNAHQHDLDLYKKQSREAPTEALRLYFTQTLPMIEKHLSHCKRLQTQL